MPGDTTFIIVLNTHNIHLSVGISRRSATLARASDARPPFGARCRDPDAGALTGDPPKTPEEGLRRQTSRAGTLRARLTPNLPTNIIPAKIA